MSSDSVDVLAVGAHPDDIELGCGGFLLLSERRGRITTAVDLSAGECGTRGDRATRIEEARVAGHRLGLRWRRCLGLPDAALRDDDVARGALVAVLREARPCLLIGPSAADPHPDHRAAAELLSAAWFLSGLARYRPDLGPPHRAPRRLEMVVRPGRTPDLLVPIDAVWPTKREVLALHQSQMAPGAIHRIGGADPLAAAETVARAFGLLAGSAHAEGFDAPGGWVVDDLLADRSPPPSAG